MLILSRKRDQKVEITLPDGQKATVLVSDIRGDQVSLGFDFPRSYPIERDNCGSKKEDSSERR